MGLYGNGFNDYMNGNNTSFESVFEYADNFLNSLDAIFETIEMENIYREAGADVTLALPGPVGKESIVKKILEAGKVIFRKFVDAVKTFFTKTLPEVVSKLYQNTNVKDKLYTFLGKGIVTYSNMEKAKENGWKGLSANPKDREFIVVGTPSVYYTKLFKDIAGYTTRREKPDFVKRMEQMFGNYDGNPWYEWEDKDSLLFKLQELADEIGKCAKQKDSKKALADAQEKYSEFEENFKEFNRPFKDEFFSNIRGNLFKIGDEIGGEFGDLIGIPEDKNGAGEGYYYPDKRCFETTVKTVEEGQKMGREYKAFSRESLKDVKELKDVYKANYDTNAYKDDDLSKIIALDAKAHLELYRCYLKRSNITIRTVSKVFVLFQKKALKSYLVLAKAIKKYVDKDNIENKNDKKEDTDDKSEE